MLLCCNDVIYKLLNITQKFQILQVVSLNQFGLSNFKTHHQNIV